MVNPYKNYSGRGEGYWSDTEGGLNLSYKRNTQVDGDGHGYWVAERGYGFGNGQGGNYFLYRRVEEE